MKLNNNLNEIRELFAPPADLSTFDPGQYFSDMEFSQPDVPYSPEDVDGLAQMVFFCDYMALDAQSPKRADSQVIGNTSFFRTLRANLSSLQGWDEVESIVAQQGYLYFTDLVQFLLRFFEPHPPKRS